MTLKSTLIGPALGGYLAEPVSKYPFLFSKGSLWETYPYLLPNVLSAALLLLCAILGLFFLRESHPELKHQPDVLHWIIERARQLFSGTSSSESTRYQHIGNEDDVDDHELNDLPTPATPRFQSTPIDRRKAFTALVCTQIASYALLGYLKVAVVATEPVFLGLPRQETQLTLLHILFGSAGGFGLSTNAMSNVMFTQAAAAIFSQWFLVTPIIKRWGPLRAYRGVLLVFMVVFVICPVATSLSWALGLTVVVLIFWVYSLVNTLGTTVQNIMYVFTLLNSILLVPPLTVISQNQQYSS